MVETDIFVRTEDVVQRHVAGEDILVPVRGNVADMQRLFALEGAARFVWELLDGNKSLKDIAGAIASEFGIDEERAFSDVGKFMKDMLKQGLVAQV